MDPGPGKRKRPEGEKRARRATPAPRSLPEPCLLCRQPALHRAYVCGGCRTQLLRGEYCLLQWARTVQAILAERMIRRGSGRQKKAATLAGFAAEIGRPERTIRHRLAMAEKVERELADRPDLLEAVEAGTVEPGRALRIRRQEARAAMCAITAEHLAAARATADVRCCDFRELLSELREVDLVLTDPPYTEASLPLYADLARLAVGALAPHGTLAVLTRLPLPDV